jgi:hypothetical protein
MANSPLPGLMMSLDQFKNAGVPIDRVVVGLPWYGLPDSPEKAATVPDSLCADWPVWI